MIALGPRALMGEEAGPVLRFSQTRFSAFRGDFVVLSIEGATQPIHWDHNGNQECAAKNPCTLDTALWDTGFHKVKIETATDTERILIAFTIDLRAKPASQKNTRVTPSLVTASPDIKRIARDQIVTRALKGMGFATSAKHSTLIQAQNTVLDVDTHLRANLESLVLIQKPSQFEFLMLPHTEMTFSPNRPGKSNVFFLSGALRARNFGMTMPWTLFVTDWLQVDGSPQTDVIVRSNDDDTIALVVLRGDVRLTSKGRGKPRPFTQRRVAAGACMTIKPYASVLTPVPCNFPWVEGLIAETSPQLVVDALGADDKNMTPLYRLKPNATAESVLAELGTTTDAPLILEALIPFANEADTNYALALAIAGASERTHLVAQAQNFYAKALAIQASSRPHYHLGLLQLAADDKGKAESEFNAALSENDLYKQEIMYYRGTIAFQRDDLYRARRHFRRSLVAGEEPIIKASTETHLQAIAEQTFATLELSVAAISNSNVLHVHSTDDIPAYITARAGRGVSANESFAYDLARSPSYASTFSFTADQVLYDNTTLNNANRFTETFALSARSIVLDSMDQPLLTLAVTPRLGAVNVASQTTDHKLGYDLSATLHRSWGATSLLFEDTQVFDRSPDHKLMDTDLWEILATQGDRTHRFRAYTARYQPHLPIEVTFSATYKYAWFRVAQSDEYTELRPAFALKWSLTPDFVLNLNLTQTQRSFPSSADGRKDNRITIDSNLCYEYAPSWTIFTGASILSQTSTRTTSDFTTHSILAGLGFRL